MARLARLTVTSGGPARSRSAAGGRHLRRCRDPVAHRATRRCARVFRQRSGRALGGGRGADRFAGVRQLAGPSNFAPLCIRPARERGVRVSASARRGGSAPPPLSSSLSWRLACHAIYRPPPCPRALSLALVIGPAVLSLLTMGCGDPPGEPPARSSDDEPAWLATAPRVSTLRELPTTAWRMRCSRRGPPDLSPSRPYKYKVPSRYDATKATPLIVMLHGFTASGELNELILHLAPLAESKGFLYAFPDGTQNPLGMRFWNATDFCCNFFGSTVDDVAYITAVIDDMASRFNVDKKRIFLVGHSNGGFMSHRMACDRSSKDRGHRQPGWCAVERRHRCTPTDKVAVLQVHGNLDTLVAYGGGPLYPGARETVAIWASRNGCTGRLGYGGKRLDSRVLLPGAETKIEEYGGCPANAPVELWTIEGGSHVPAFTSFWPTAIHDFLMAHPALAAGASNHANGWPVPRLGGLALRLGDDRSFCPLEIARD